MHEAVQRLTEEGLIEVVQRVGTFVARIPLDQLEEAMLVRTALEVAVVEKATNADHAGRPSARLKQLLADQHACVEANDIRVFTLTSCSTKPWRYRQLPRVWPIILQSKMQVDRYRQLTLPIPGRMDGVVEQHKAVVDALEEARVSDAANAMHDHLNLVPVVQVAKQLRPEYFINHLETGR